MKSNKGKSRKSSQTTDKEKLVDSLLESLHYDEKSSFLDFLLQRKKTKEDIATIKKICEIFHVPDKRSLRNYLIEKVDFTELFVKLLEFVEPFSIMMKEIYEFLDEQRKTARATDHLIIGESARNSVSFDLEIFRELYLPVIQKIEGYLRTYSLENILNSNISPLFRTEGLLNCGFCTDQNYQKSEACLNCDDALRKRFGEVFQQLEVIIAMIPSTMKSQSPFTYLCEYYKKAKDQFRSGTHHGSECWGYKDWDARLQDIEWSINHISEKRSGVYDIEVPLRFFELPFWRQRNRLYEIWTLIHFIHLLRGVTVDLTINEDGKWYLMYGDAKEPVATVYGQGFNIKIYYQHKLKTGLKMASDEPIEPEMLFIYEANGSEPKNLILIECKERLDYAVREIMNLATFYRAQAGTQLNIFCNYYEYLPQQGYRKLEDEPPIILVDQFRPGSPVVDQVDHDFLTFMKEKLGDFLQAVLIDVSGSMKNKNIEFVYRQLNKYLSQLPGSKSLGGIFSDHIELSEYNELIQKLHYSRNIGGGTKLSTSLENLRSELIKKHGEFAAINFYIITDIDFIDEDWEWLRSIDNDTSHNITFVAQSTWVNSLARRRLEDLKRIKLMFL